MMRILNRRLRRRWYVRLTYADGSWSFVGPMKSRFAAEVYVELHVSPHPFDRQYRRVASARIVGP